MSGEGENRIISEISLVYRANLTDGFPVAWGGPATMVTG